MRTQSRTITMTEDQYSDMLDDNCGMCLACGAEADCCEPDAREYECENCGQSKVYGLEELLVMGCLEFREED